MRNPLKIGCILLAAIVLAVVGVLSSCTGLRVTGSGNIISKTYDFADFTKIHLSYGFTAEVKASNSYKIEVNTDDNLFDFIYVKKDGDTLSIGMKPGSYEQSQLQATIMLPVLHGMVLSDGGRTNVSGFSSSDDLSIKLSDGTRLTGSLTAGNVDIGLIDGSRVELTGSAQNFKIISHDGSRAVLADFTVTNASLNIDDGGTISIGVTGKIDADLSAGSHVTYKGNPSMGSIKLSSGSTLDPQN
jgi:hypothetical protein